MTQVHPNWLGGGRKSRRRNYWRPDAPSPIVPDSDVSRVGCLSIEQRDLLAEMAAGKDSRDAAEQRGVSPSAIKFQLSEIYRTLGMNGGDGKIARATFLYGCWIKEHPSGE